MPIYGGTVVLCNTLDEFKQAHDYLAGTPLDDYPRGGCALNLRNTRTGDRIYLIGVFDKHYATLAHELAHATFFILGDVGVPCKEGENNEAFCYLLTHLLVKLSPHLAVA